MEYVAECILKWKLLWGGIAIVEYPGTHTLLITQGQSEQKKYKLNWNMIRVWKGMAINPGHTVAGPGTHFSYEQYLVLVEDTNSIDEVVD